MNIIIINIRLYYYNHRIIIIVSSIIAMPGENHFTPKDSNTSNK